MALDKKKMDFFGRCQNCQANQLNAACSEKNIDQSFGDFTDYAFSFFVRRYRVDVMSGAVPVCRIVNPQQ